MTYHRNIIELLDFQAMWKETQWETFELGCMIFSPATIRHLDAGDKKADS